MDNSQNELIFKNTRLEQELAQAKAQIDQLKASYEKAQSELDRLEGIISTLPKDVLPQDITIDNETGTRLLRFKMATVMYVDMRGYKSNNNEPRTQSGVDELDQIIIQFADIAAAHNLQVIKTIGDAFMCVGGIPEKNITNPVDVVLSAMEMVRYTKSLKAMVDDDNKFWELRIGIHTGPVVATVNGKKKFSYDIKGETVNIATRMAAAAEHDKINVSVYTYELVREYFVTDYNGVTPVKYHGDLEMYYVRRLRPALSVNKKIGEYPNDIFKIKYALRQFTDLQEFVLDKLERELPKTLHYHNYHHRIRQPRILQHTVCPRNPAQMALQRRANQQNLRHHHGDQAAAKPAQPARKGNLRRRPRLPRTQRLHSYLQRALRRTPRTRHRHRPQHLEQKAGQFFVDPPILHQHRAEVARGGEGIPDRTPQKTHRGRLTALP